MGEREKQLRTTQHLQQFGVTERVEVQILSCDHAGEGEGGGRDVAAIVCKFESLSVVS